MRYPDTLLTRSTRQHRPSTCPLSHQRHRHVDALGGYSVLGPWASWSCARWFMLSLLRCRWVPLGPWSGSLFTTAGWAHRAAVCEYVTAYTFLCAPCLRCYRLSLDSFFVAWPWRALRAAVTSVDSPDSPSGGQAVSRPGVNADSSLLVSPHKAKPRRHYRTIHRTKSTTRARSPPPKATQYKRDQSRTGHRTTAHSRSHSGPYGP